MRRTPVFILPEDMSIKSYASLLHERLVKRMEKIIFADGTEFGCALYPIETEPSLFEKNVL